MKIKRIIEDEIIEDDAKAMHSILGAGLFSIFVARDMINIGQESAGDYTVVYSVKKYTYN
jgi:hypothetical protein